MTQQWTSHLNQSGTLIDTALSHNILTDLSHLGLIKVSGQAAEKFLQGQFTNDVRLVNAERSQLSAWCSSKGRILVTFRLFKRQQELYLLLPKDSVETTLKRLKMYVLRAAVTLESIEESMRYLGIAGLEAHTLLTTSLGFTLPLEKSGVVTSGDITVLNVSDIQPRYIVLSDPHTYATVWAQLATTLQIVDTNRWQLFDILAGLPQITTTTSDEFVPQMVNLQAIEGVNFRKGCYAGQEVVARLQYLGALKRRLYLVKINATTAAPQIGDELYTTHDSVGKIINVQWHPTGYYVALAVIQIAQAETETLHYPQGCPLQLFPLPYTLNS